MIETERLRLRKPAPYDADMAFVGRVGTQLLPEGWELGWTITPEHRIDRIISLIAPDNLPSQRVAERLGAAPTETVILPDSTEAVVWLHP